MFADNITFVAHTHQDAQEIIILFAKAAKAFGLESNAKNSLSTCTRLSL